MTIPCKNNETKNNIYRALELSQRHKQLLDEVTTARKNYLKLLNKEETNTNFIRSNESSKDNEFQQPEKHNTEKKKTPNDKVTIKFFDFPFTNSSIVTFEPRYQIILKNQLSIH